MSAYFDSLNRRTRVAVVRPLEVPSERIPFPKAQPARRPVPTNVPIGYRTLRERLLVLGSGNTLKSLVFSGCDGGEGCTRVVREFAEYLAMSGLNVLLVDADFRTAALTTSLASQSENLVELVNSGHVASPIEWGRGHLTVVPNTLALPDKERFLATPALAAWLTAQRDRYDYVLLDAPPLLAVADGTLLGRLCDGVVIVVQAGRTPQNSIGRARRQLEDAGVNVVGAVLNRMADVLPSFLKPFLATE